MEHSRNTFIAGRVRCSIREFSYHMKKDMQMSARMSMQMKHLLSAQGPQFFDEKLCGSQGRAIFSLNQSKQKPMNN